MLILQIMKSAFLSFAACCFLLPALYASHSVPSTVLDKTIPLPLQAAIPAPPVQTTATEEAIHCRVELTNGVVVECWLCNCANLYASLMPQSPPSPQP